MHAIIFSYKKKITFFQLFCQNMRAFKGDEGVKFHPYVCIYLRCSIIILTRNYTHILRKRFYRSSKASKSKQIRFLYQLYEYEHQAIATTFQFAQATFSSSTSPFYQPKHIESTDVKSLNKLKKETTELERESV